jgi:hypothetical protein
MKAVLNTLAGFAITASVMSSASAAVLENLQLNLPGANGPVITEVDYLDFSGKSFVTNTYGTSSFTFTDNGIFNVTGHSGGSSLGIPGQITARYTGGTGTGSLANGSITFAAGGTLDLYYNPTYVYDKASAGASAANDNGSTVGTKIATFTQLAGGGGIINPNGTPDSNGMLTLLFKATYFLDGVWNDENGKELQEGLTLGFVTSNASQDISDINSRFRESLSGSPTTGNDTATPLKYFYVKNGGQLTLETNEVPEPASLAIFGAGLLGLAALRRRKA